MDISHLTLKLIIIFFPGLLAAIFFEKLTVRRQSPPYVFFLNAFVFGIASYVVVYLPMHLPCALPCVRETGNATIPLLAFINTPEVTLANLADMAYASLVSLALGPLASRAINGAWLHRFCHRWRFTNKMEDVYVWQMLVNSPGILKWVFLWDYKNMMTHKGLIKLISDRDDAGEIFMTNVTVYDEQGQKVREADSLYLHFNPATMVVEFL